VFWWISVALVVAAFLLYGLLRWVSADPGVVRELATARFRDEQDYRALRRTGKLIPR
jgi:hypothetical protein